MLSGIIFPSSIENGGLSCVLFIENDQCCDPPIRERFWKPYLLVLHKVERQNLTKILA